MSENPFDRILKAMGNDPYRPGLDVVRRIEVLLGNEEERYVDVLHTSKDNAHAGVAVLLTPSRVIRAEWDRPRGSLSGSGEATATVETWPRKALISASIETGLGNYVNTDRDWGEDWEDKWPHSCVLTLRYEGRSQPLMLPLQGASVTREGFRKVLPELLADLDR